MYTPRLQPTTLRLHLEPTIDKLLLIARGQEAEFALAHCSLLKVGQGESRTRNLSVRYFATSSTAPKWILSYYTLAIY